MSAATGSLTKLLEGQLGPVQEVLDVVSLGEAPHEVKPAGVHKPVQRHVSLHLVAAGASRQWGEPYLDGGSALHAEVPNAVGRQSEG